MRELGISVEETAIMSAITPVVGLLMPPLAGLLADKIGNFRVCINSFIDFNKSINAEFAIKIEKKNYYTTGFCTTFNCAVVLLTTQSPLRSQIPVSFKCD